MKPEPTNNPSKQSRASKRSGVREQRLARPLAIRVTEAEYDEIERLRPTNIADYQRILGDDHRCSQIMSAAHHGVEMYVEVALAMIRQPVVRITNKGK